MALSGNNAAQIYTYGSGLIYVDSIPTKSASELKAGLLCDNFSLLNKLV